MSIGLTKEWQPLSDEALADLPAQLGVFQIADARAADGQATGKQATSKQATSKQAASKQSAVLSIGYAGARHPFGMRTALELDKERLEALSPQTHGQQTHGQTPALFRVEFTSNYLSRWNELLMLHVAEFGELPVAQGEQPNKLGHLTPAAL